MTLNLGSKNVGDGLGGSFGAGFYQDSATGLWYPAPVLNDPNGVLTAALAPNLAALDGILAAETTGALGASGVTPVFGAFTANTQSPYFTPIYGRPINITIWGTFQATIALYRQITPSSAGGALNVPITAGGSQILTWTGPASERYTEYEVGVKVVLICSNYVSGSANIRLAQ